jgi:ABC-type transporter Mla subunit MlaD
LQFRRPFSERLPKWENFRILPVMKSRPWSDWVIALSVIVSSLLLLAALGYALSGVFFGEPARVVYADFVDVTGISVHSRVKVAGANAGNVAGIHWLDESERSSSANPDATVRLKLALGAGVPPLREGTHVSIAADTILSDKFVQVEPGPAGGDLLAEGAVVPGITPVTFDRLVRNVDGALESLSAIVGGGADEAAPLFIELTSLLDDTRQVVSEARPMVADMRAAVDEARKTLGIIDGLVVDADGVLSENREPIARAVHKLDAAATEMQKLAGQSSKLVDDSSPAVESAARDLERAAEDARVATTYLKILALRLAQNPSLLLWSRPSPLPIPTEEEILRKP